METSILIPTGDSSAAALIPLEQMTQQAKVHAPQEDWTGVTDSRLRRKLQNRLNQRSRRKCLQGDIMVTVLTNAH